MRLCGDAIRVKSYRLPCQFFLNIEDLVERYNMSCLKVGRPEVCLAVRKLKRRCS
jgi:hypothetical protein